MGQDFQTNNNQPEKAFLVGVAVRGTHTVLSLRESIQELGMLAETAGMQVIGSTSQQLHHIDPGTYIGSGKVQEIIETIRDNGAQAVIFDDELSPRHQRELSKKLGNEIKLLDRSALILDIFAQHAKTREGALQVELAQYEYRLPRLTRQWTHLARQAGGMGGAGGVGLRGPGETQLEVDRREISRKITNLKSEIEHVRQHRSQYRNQRRRSGIPIVALVGYTNAGKSTLLNYLSGSDVYVADQLFATLDPTTRRISLPAGLECLLSDTVGFIQKLPTTLIAAFRATLEEISEASLLLHVVDSSHPSMISHIETVEDTLAEIDVIHVPRILVWNKIDRMTEEIDQATLNIGDSYDAQVRVSAVTGEGIELLKQEVTNSLTSQFKRQVLLIPYSRGDMLSHLFQSSRVIRHTATARGTIVEAELTAGMSVRYSQFAYVEHENEED